MAARRFGRAVWADRWVLPSESLVPLPAAKTCPGSALEAELALLHCDRRHGHKKSQMTAPLETGMGQEQVAGPTLRRPSGH